MPDPTLAELLAEVRATRATLERVEAELCRRDHGHAPRGSVPIKEAERLLGVSVRQIRRWCVEEGLGQFNGRKWFVDLDAVYTAGKRVNRTFG